MNGILVQKKNIIVKLMLGLILVIAFVFMSKVSAAINTGLPISVINESFPTSYQSYINSLKQKYPNATFKAVHTGLNWGTVLTHETYEINDSISTIHQSYGDAWKKNGQNNYIDGPYVTASKNAVAYVIDPRNSLTEQYVFQFESLIYNSAITNVAIENVIKNTAMVGTYAKQYKKAGTWLNMDLTYAQTINKVAQEQNVSAIYMAARMRQETGGDIVNNGSINGSVKYSEERNYQGYYNFFNIGASPSYKGATDSVENGLKHAKNQGWTTPYLSITGGIKKIKSTYIDYGQYTIYFQKFDVNNPPSKDNPNKRSCKISYGLSISN